MPGQINKLLKALDLFVEALSGSEKTYTTGSIRRALILLSVPMILEMVMEALFAVVDVFFVSRISINAVATVGLTESFLTIIYSVAIGLSMATTAIVARRVGEGAYKRASDAGFQAIFLGVLTGLLLGIVGFFFAEDALQLMGGDADLITEGKGFTRIMFGGNLSIFLLFLNNGIFRGAGDASVAMKSLILANGLNMLLDPLLIFGWGPVPAMGIEGAAIATTIGRSIGVIYQIYHFTAKTGIVRIGWQNVVFRGSTLWELVRIAAGGMGQFLIESASWIFLVRVMSIFGSESLAGYTISMRVIVFSILPAFGLANAAATLVGQNLGAGQADRAESSVWKAALYTVVFLGGISLVYYGFADSIIGFFDPSGAVKAVGVSALKIVCLGYVFFAYGMVISQAFNGAGDSFTPLIINLIVFWLVQIPLAYWLAVTLAWAGPGVFWSIAISHSLHAIACVYLFRKGRWKLTKV